MSALFIAAGQSEMYGYGLTAADLPTHLEDPIAGAMIWTAGGFEVLEPGVNTGSATYPEMWGPVAEFAYQWTQDHPGETAYFVLSAKGSTGLAADAGGLDWSPSSTGEMYDATTTMVADAKAALATLGVSTHVDAILWDQGQTDALVASWASTYQANLTDLFAGARADWAETTTPIVYARVSSASAFAYGEDVQAAQDAVDAADGNAVAINTDAQGLQADGVHYDASGQVAEGAGLYLAWSTAPRVITGTAGDDVAWGAGGADSLSGGGGSDWLFGDAGDDWLQGNGGADSVYGGQGNDTVIGGADADVVRGGKGDDVLEGANGDDWLAGDLGNDTLSGGAGADVFYFAPGSGADQITDFDLAAGDRLQLDPGDAYTVTLSGADTIVAHGSGDAIVLVGVHLSAGDGLFVGS